MAHRILAVTPGDPDGVGPEIVWKTLVGGKVPRGFSLLCVGARKPFEKLKARIIPADPAILSGESLRPPREKRPHVWLLEAPTSSAGLLEGHQAGWSIATATRLALSGKASALVTGPISKERLQQGGYPFAGHTELLAELCNVPKVTMMLANDQLRVTMVTTHIGLKQVSESLTREKIRHTITQTAEHLRRWWGIRKPRIAVAALNPHAGEGGLFGEEEIRVIAPELQSLRRKAGRTMELIGPLPADTLFAHHIMESAKKRYDAVVCMYHDQGLIPVKLLDFPKTVNVTLGLPIIRTSVDHGVAFDIAGKGLADPSSFQAAVKLASRLAGVREKKR